MSSDVKIFFRLHTDDWESFAERLDLHFFVNEINRSDVKTAILLTHVDEETYKLLKKLCAPEKPASKSYDDLMNILTPHVRSVSEESLMLSRAEQERNETIADLPTQMRHLALNFDFNETLPDLFMLDIRDESIRIDAFKRSKLNSSGHVDRRAWESAVENAAAAREILGRRHAKPGNFAMGCTEQHKSEKHEHLGTATTAFGMSSTSRAWILDQSSATTTSVFHAPSTTPTSIFGAPPTTAPPAFGMSSTTAASMVGIPSMVAPTAFGRPSTTALPAFGTPSTTGTLLFGTLTTPTSTTFAFGASKTTASLACGSNTTKPAFGGTRSTSTDLFGSSNVNAASKTTTRLSTPLVFGNDACYKNIFKQAVDKINPNVVIHAGGASESESPGLPATINSTTLTTNVNTSPLTTSAVAKVVTDNERATTAKHSTLDPTSYQSAESSSRNSTNTITAVDPKTSFVVDGNSSQVFKSGSMPSLVTSSAVATTKSLDTSNTVSLLNPISGVFTSSVATSTAQTNGSVTPVTSKPDVSTPPSLKSDRSVSSAAACNTSTVSNNARPSSQSSKSVQSSTSLHPTSSASSFGRQTVHGRFPKQGLQRISIGTAPTTIANTFSSFGQTPSVGNDKKASSSTALGHNPGTTLPSFNKLIPTSLQPPTTSYSSFESGTNTYATQSTNATTSSFEMASDKTAPVFMSPTIQNLPPTFGSMPSSQPQTTSSQNVSTTGIANPPLFNAITTTPQNPSSPLTTAASIFGSTSTSVPTMSGTPLTTAPPAGMLFGTENRSTTPVFPIREINSPGFSTINCNSNPSSSFAGTQSQAQGSTFSLGATATSCSKVPAAPFLSWEAWNYCVRSRLWNHFNLATTTPAMNFESTSASSLGAPVPGTNTCSAGSPTVPASGLFSIGVGFGAPISKSKRSPRKSSCRL